MKTNKYLLLISIFVLTMFFGCEDMMDTHSEYVQDGEIIYSVKVDSVYLFPGNNRVKLKGYLKNALQVTNIIVKWENADNSEQIETIAYDFNQSPDSFMAEIPIDEGQYLLEFITMNEAGNTSVSTKVDGKVYGEKYRSYLENRPIQKILPNISGGAMITFAPAASNLVTMNFEYQTVDGTQKNLVILPDQSELLIEDVDLYVPINYASGYIPSETAIDTFFCDVEEISLEYLTDIAFEIDKSSFEIIDFSTEEQAANEGGGNGPAVNIIDGDNSSYWQSQWADGIGQIPHHITIDMKNEFNVTQVDLFRRNSNNHTKTVVLEGSTDNVNWEEFGTLNYSSDGSIQKELIELTDGKRMRYIKINVTESNVPPYVSLAEIYVIGKL
ncbi:DUF4998 domain-containing protein [Sunxiuqinia rutila]|uniref:DUF4998 domain-containing protein n=1 Tax=Sunxiuqinia rutila TaxID=1397841 RepID=UPI003D36C223